MKITFLGAVREVTGSMHLLTTETDEVLLDFGMFQGRRKETAEKNRQIPFDSRKISNMVLSHAHIDHSGRIPLLTRNGFTGRVICTRVTADACGYLLPDSARIQESDAGYLNYKAARQALQRNAKVAGTGKRTKKNDVSRILKHKGHRLNTDKINEVLQSHHIDGIQPLYTETDARQALSHFAAYPYRHPVDIGDGVDCTLYEAGHILGSALTMIHSGEKGKARTVCYTGDIGRFGKPIIRDPAGNFKPEHRNVDLMIMESTYGGRIHEPLLDLKPVLKEILLDTSRRGGTIIIPAFAYGRTQELLYVLHELYNEGEVPNLPIFVDSPLATSLTKVFGEHPEVYDDETHETFLEKGLNPFFFNKIHFVGSVEESMALNREEKPHIVISASGMCEAGRVLHHLRHKIHNPKHTVLIVGFMAQLTLGRRILEKGTAYEATGRTGSPPVVKILNKEYPLKAHVVKIGGFSAHADRQEMLEFLNKSNLTIKKIAVVHGEEEQSLAFAEYLSREGYSAFVPKPGEVFELE